MSNKRGHWAYTPTQCTPDGVGLLSLGYIEDGKETWVAEMPIEDWLKLRADNTRLRAQVQPLVEALDAASDLLSQWTDNDWCKAKSGVSITDIKQALATAREGLREEDL